MPIKLVSQEMTVFGIDDIIQYYNYLRPDGSEPIEYLHSKDGGYQILCSDRNNVFHGQYKQLRWQRKILISYYNYPSFSIEEELLLYNMMRYVLGKENVSYYLSYDQAIKHSPSFKSSVLSSILACDSAYRKLPIEYSKIHNNVYEDNSDSSSQSSDDYYTENHKSRNFVRRNTEPLQKLVGHVSKIFTKSIKSEKEKTSSKKQIIIDNSEVSLSTTSGWKYPRIRI
jgi:hypothetical protein